jgi:hypothetical protein
VATVNQLPPPFSNSSVALHRSVGGVAVAVDIYKNKTMPTMEDIMYTGHPGAPVRPPPPSDDDRCAGCTATGLALLACDDIDDSGEATSGRRSRCVIVGLEDLSLPI